MKAVSAISSDSQATTSQQKERPACTSAAQAADAMRAAVVAYLVAQGPTVCLDALTRPIPALGNPVFDVARSTFYSAAHSGQLPFSTFHVGRRVLASTTAVLRALELDE
jgi:hypothetical protein